MPRSLCVFVCRAFVVIGLTALSAEAQADPHEDLAREFVASIQARDAARLEKLLPTFEEYQGWVEARWPAEAQAEFSREWFDQMRVGMVEEFTEGLSYVRDEHPCVAPELLSYAGHGLGEEGEGGFYAEHGARMLWIDLDASYPGTGALRFRLTMEVFAQGERVLPADFEIYLVEQPSAPLRAITEQAVKAFLFEDLALYYSLLSRPEDVRWYADHRMPKEHREAFEVEWLERWGNPLYLSHELDSFYVDLASKRAYLPGEVASFEIREFMIDPEVDMDDRFKTHVVGALVDITKADGSKAEMEIMLELAQGAGRLTLVEYDLEYEDEATPDEAYVAKVEEGPGWAKVEAAAELRRCCEAKDWDRAILLGTYLTMHIGAGDPNEDFETCVLLAEALSERFADPGDLAQAADLYDWARSMYQDGEISAETWKSWLESHRKPVGLMAVKLFEASQAASKAGAEDWQLQPYFIGVIRAGAIAGGEFDKLRALVAMAGIVVGDFYVDAEQLRDAFDIYVTALPLDDAFLAMDPAAMAKYLDLKPAQVSNAYFRFASTALNVIAPDYDSFLKTGHLSDYKAEKFREHTEPGDRALRVVEKTLPGNERVAELRGKYQRVFKTLEDEGK